MRIVANSILVGLAVAFIGCNNNREVTVLKIDPKPVEQPKQAPQQVPPGVQPQAQPPAKTPQVREQKPGLVQTIRGRVARTERVNELRNIGQFFSLYANDVMNPNQRSAEGFKAYYKQARAIAEAIDTQQYVVNVKARQSGESVVAYEDVLEDGGYMAVWGDGRVERVAATQLQEKLR